MESGMVVKKMSNESCTKKCAQAYFQQMFNQNLNCSLRASFVNLLFLSIDFPPCSFKTMLPFKSIRRRPFKLNSATKLPLGLTTHLCQAQVSFLKVS